MSYTINPNAKNRWARNAENTMDLSLETDASSVYLDNGRTLEQEIGEGSMVSNAAIVDTSISKIIDGTLDGAYESLVFKGKSLVNLVTHSKRQNTNVQNLLDSNGRLSWNTTGAWGKVGFTVQGKPNSTYCVKYGDKHTTLGIYMRYVDGLNGTTQPITALNSTCKKFTTDTTGIFTLTLEQGEATTNSWVQDFMILEYIEGMENWDIPYFTGLCDVKMPVLTTTGKNLLNSSWKKEYGKFYPFKLKKGTTLTLSTKDSVPSLGGNLLFTTVSGREKWFSIDAGATKNTITLDEDVYQVNNVLAGDIEYQLELGSIATLYEPYKSNILHTSEEIVLREVNGVCDTYNVLTGEYVKRIGEKVFDGSSDEKWSVNKNITGGKQFVYNASLRAKSGNTTVISNRLPSIVDANESHVENIWIYNGTTIVIHKNLQDVNELKTWLSQNPITVQYELAKPITTIVESLTTPFTYENGHIILESGYEGQSLLPTLEYSTVVNKTGLVENVAKTIQRQEKQLTMLEQMLIQNIINLDYNNTLLTLKNEMEEML